MQSQDANLRDPVAPDSRSRGARGSGGQAAAGGGRTAGGDARPAPSGGRAAHRQLLERLDRVRLRLRIVVLAESLVHAGIVLLVIGPSLFLMDNFIHFTTPLRLTGFLVLLLGLLGTFIASVRVAFQHWGHERLALRIETRFPELENRLINAVQLGTLDPSSRAYPLVTAIVEETVREASARRWRDAVDTRGLRRGLAAGLVLAVVMSLYPAFFGQYFFNGALRIFFPTRLVMPITRTRMAVSPGDAVVNKNGSFRVAADSTGPQMPRSAHLEIRNSRFKTGFTMDFDGKSFLHELTDVAEDFRYRVSAGDFESPWYNVRVIEKPDVARMVARYEYPPYTLLSPDSLDPFNGNLTALAGTRATITAFLNKPVLSASLVVERGARIEARPPREGAPAEKDAPPAIEASLTIQQNGRYQWALRDAQGYDNSPAQLFAIAALEDKPPRVAITSPRGEVEVPKGELLTVMYSASDDYGLAWAQVLALRGDKKETVQSSRFDPPRKTLNEGYVLRTENLEAGDEIRLAAAVRDTNPAASQSVESEKLLVRIVAPKQESGEASGALKDLFVDLVRILERQIAARRDLDKWRVVLSAGEAKAGQLESLLRPIVVAQSEIRAATLILIGVEGITEPFWVETRAGLETLAAGEMRQAVEALETLAKTEAKEARLERTTEARDLQTAIIERLRKILGSILLEKPELKEAVPQAEELLKEKNERLPPSTMQDLYGSVQDFIKDQKGLLNTMQKMENVNPDDLATTYAATLENLAEMEEKWSEYFKDAADWLRESPMVGGTDSGLREELIEIYNQIDVLPKELRSETKTIEVSADNTGLELAEELTTELEKWLAEEPDFTKWVMENAPEDYEVPLVDLPDELTDLVGDLIESEESMTEAVEDVTSNWADSLDKGAGWEAADGPMSNYSAKGVTGNVLPNDMDISGRSGEGRTGRSLGEMVENVATGKGGRDTQTRITNDAMGEGVVEDLSTEQVKGATGGGKIAGTTGYGLVSATAPEQPEMNQKLAQRQADIRMKAISLHNRLMQLNMPSANLENSIRTMGQIEQALQEGRYNNFRDLKAVVVRDLKDQRSLVGEHFRLGRDTSAAGQGKLRHEAGQGEHEDFPEAYRSLLSAYYEALSAAPER